MGLAPVAYNLWRILRRLGLSALGRWINALYQGWRQLRLLISPREPAALHQGDSETIRRELMRRCEAVEVTLSELREETRSQAQQLRRSAQALEETQRQQTAALDTLSRDGDRLHTGFAKLDTQLRERDDTLRQQADLLHKTSRDLSITRASLQAQRNQIEALLAQGQAGAENAGTNARSPVTAAAAEDGSEQQATPAPGAAPDAALDARIACYYDAFEAHCRGSEEAIRGKQRPYLEVITGLPAGLLDKPLIDIGSGHGEWLGLLRDQGLRAFGIDNNASLATHCRSRGLTVLHGDALSQLGRQEADSAAVISAFHIVEHLPFATLFALLEEIRRVLAPGGMLLLETPNPENALVGSHTFYHDFSHRNPVTPTALEFLVAYHGFEDIEVRRLHPYREEAQIKEDSIAAQRLNLHFYGPQDYAVIARLPGELSQPQKDRDAPDNADAD